MDTNNVQVIWGTPILDDGFANVPNMLIRNYRKLGITHAEFGLIMNLITYKHDAGNPYPSQETLANSLDSSTRAVRKLISSLEDKELIWVEYQYIEGKRSSNIYVLKPMIDKCLEMFGESRLPDYKPKKKTYRKVRNKIKNLEEPHVPVVQEPQVPVGMEPEVPEAQEPRVPTNITSEYNNKNITKEYNNPSITESRIQELDLHIGIQKRLIINIDRLKDDHIDLDDIKINYLANKDKINEFQYAEILANVLRTTKGTIKNIGAVMNVSIKNYMSDQIENIPNVIPETNHEVVPDWFHERKKQRHK